MVAWVWLGTVGSWGARVGSFRRGEMDDQSVVVVVAVAGETVMIVRADVVIE